MRTVLLFLLCCVMVGCSGKSKQEKVSQDAVNNTVGINDTLGISLHPECPVYSTKQKRITFILSNNSDADIGFGGYYSYTYEDEKGIWRDVPMQLVVFDVETVLLQGNKGDYCAELFRRTPGRYRFFLTIRRHGKEYTLMAEFQLSDHVPDFLKNDSDNQVNDTLPPTEVRLEDPVFTVVERMPEFPGGNNALLPFIDGRLQYPAQARMKGVQGKVIVQFTVDENGCVVDPTIVRSVEPSLDKEALRIINAMPQWKPGTLKGKAVKVCYTVPVAFKLDGLSKEVSSGKSDTRLLRPAPRKIPNGERISPALLSIKTANDCYPLSTTEVKITVTNYSRQEYTCGNDYSIAYYAPDKRRWEALPVSPTFEDVGWHKEKNETKHFE